MSAPLSSTTSDLLRLIPHLEIAHHIPGRIRLRVHLSGLDVVRDVDLRSLVLSIPGVLDMRINLPARSVVIEYNHQQLPYELWETAGRLKSQPELSAQFESRLNALWDH